ncbi:MAG: nitroreductase family protein [Defluviitaleaceae bacterium]|nr:nitroreductase family protein [Defluviitaleaceae bacterium]
MNMFPQIMENRRSTYNLSNEFVVSEEKTKEIIAHALKFTPTAFNAQEQRLVLLLGERHKWFWNQVKQNLKAIVPEADFPATNERINGFLNGTGTVLFYQDTAVIAHLQEPFPLYKDNFPIWAQQVSGMLKYTVWTTLADSGYGANIQHYTEVVETDANKELNINRDWKMVGQLVFGKAESDPNPDKTFEPIKKRLIVYK